MYNQQPWRPRGHPGQPPYRPPFNNRQPPSSVAPVAPVKSTMWSTNDSSNYSAVYEAEPSSGIRKVKGLKTSAQQSSTSQGAGIKGKDFGYAFVGKEADRYIREELRDEMTSSLSPMTGDLVAPSPLTPAKITPRMLVDEFKRRGHYDTTVKELRSTFQSSTPKDEFLQSLQSYLLQRLSQMPPEARQRLALQDGRLQELELNRWIEETPEASDILDELLGKMRGKEGDRESLFERHGTVGKDLVGRLAEVLRSEKTRVESKGDSSDEDGGNTGAGDMTPLEKGSITPAQISSRGSQTPMTTMLPPE
ncbi:hypothetical protein CBS101457_006255 [Exobasidium rhododendri]|nr:hypothetical protein CBS101457_006255 [Exobasidium rhododendri]